jgi:hypothetical protein
VRAKLEERQLAARSLPWINAADHVMTVRTFYLDLSQWFADDPSRWGPWVAPCLIRDTDTTARKKKRSHRKSRMDHRTRERLPVIPSWSTPSPAPCKQPPNGCTRPKPARQARCSPQRARRCAARSPATPQPAKPRPKTPTPASDAISATLQGRLPRGGHHPPPRVHHPPPCTAPQRGIPHPDR